MTALMPAGCERLLPSHILALVLELGLQGISGAVSPLDMIQTCMHDRIYRATLHLSASCC